MVSSDEDKKITLEEFKGTYDRGENDDVPMDHAIDSRNLYFTSSGYIKTRDGLVNSLSLNFSGGVRRFALLTATPLNDLEPATGPVGQVGPGLLMLGTGGNFYIDNGASPLFTESGATDFTHLNAGNRIYISPNSGPSASRAMKVKVLNSFTNAIRDAAGLAPAQASSLLAAAESATAGSVPAGVHKIAVVYETDTGFWTPPGPKIIVSCTPTLSVPCVLSTGSAHGMETGESHRIAGGTGNWSTLNDVWHITKIDDTHFSINIDTTGLGSVTGTFTVDGKFTPATVTSTGAFKIGVTNVPLGPTGTVRRLFLATRADENEFFFVPEKVGSTAFLADNTTTTATLDFLDTDLVASADYLFDILEKIPAGSSMTKYRGRIVIAGSWPDTERVLLSNIDDPETFNYVSGYIQVQTERDGNCVTSTFVLRDTLYMNKFVGMFATEDNGQNPSTWGVTVVDGAVGAYNHGTSSFTVSQPAPDTGDIILLASRSGLYLFDGVVRRPELTWKISNLWLRVNFAAFHRVTVTHDVWNHLIYIAVPLDSATEPNYVLVGDYTDGRDHQSIRWTTWQFHKSPTCIGMCYFGTDGKYKLRVSSIDSSSAKIWGLTAAQTTDDSTIIESYYQPGLMYFGAGDGLAPGGVNVFKQIEMRVKGAGNLRMELADVDGAGLTYPPVLALGTTPRKDLMRGINFVNEKMTIKLGCFSANAQTPASGDRFMLARLVVYGQQLWNSRPTV